MLTKWNTEMKKNIIFLILAITLQNYANAGTKIESFMIQNMSEWELKFDRIKRLDIEIEKSDELKNIELTCERREAVRDYITFLDKTYNSQEFLEISRRNSKLIDAREDIKKMKEDLQKSIGMYDEELRKGMNVNPEMKMITLDYLCNIWGY